MRFSRQTTLLGLALMVMASASVGGCKRSGAPVAYPNTGATVLTQVNLHPDEARASLSSVNYLQPGLLPVCTPVRIDSVHERQMLLTVIGTGRQYKYEFHKSLTTPIPQHLDRLFAKDCPKAALDALGKVDQDGIKQGKALPGMSRQGVIFAIGYPPEHSTPSLDADTWQYWVNRFDRLNVVFQNGTVASINN